MITDRCIEFKKLNCLLDLKFFSFHENIQHMRNSKIEKEFSSIKNLITIKFIFEIFSDFSEVTPE